MSQRPGRLSIFWRELKRRRVVHVITVYASAAFVLIELVNNLSEPLNLPAKLSTIVIIVLAVGFPLAIILAWLYDLTPEGIEKTRTVDEAGDQGKTKVPNAWRIATYVSFVVIAGLLTFGEIDPEALDALACPGIAPGHVVDVARRDDGVVDAEVTQHLYGSRGPGGGDRAHDL